MTRRRHDAPGQMEFCFPARKYVDYPALFERLKKSPMTTAEIGDFAGVGRGCVAQVIATLSINYPVWCPQRGLYKVCEDSDYQTVNKLEENDT